MTAPSEKKKKVEVAVVRNGDLLTKVVMALLGVLCALSVGMASFTLEKVVNNAERITANEHGVSTNERDIDRIERVVNEANSAMNELKQAITELRLELVRQRKADGG